MARKADNILKNITKQVANNTITLPGEVARRLWERLSVDLQRAGHRAFKRRAGTREMALGRGMGGILVGIEGLVQPDA